MRTPTTERGSVLMLMPAAIVIVLLLGALAVDAAIVHLEQRQAYNVAFDAANDAAGAGIDRDALRASGAITYDPDRVESVAAASVRAAAADGLRLVSATVEDGGVTVTVRFRVEHLLGRAFGAPASEDLEISARVDGEVRRGDGTFDP